MARFVMKKGDFKPVMSATLTDNDGSAINLTSATGVKFLMKLPGSSSAKIDSAGVVSDASNGKVTYQWAGTNTDTSGVYDAEFEVDWGSSQYQTFPANGYIEVEIIDDLGGDS